jgi:hypothetical protein
MYLLLEEVNYQSLSKYQNGNTVPEKQLICHDSKGSNWGVVTLFDDFHVGESDRNHLSSAPKRFSHQEGHCSYSM